MLSSMDVILKLKVQSFWAALSLICSALWRVALAGLLTIAAIQVYQLRNLPTWAQAQIEREGDKTRAAALQAIDGTRTDLLAQVSGLRADLDRHADALTGIADTRLQDITVRLDAQLSRTNDSLAQVASIRSDLNTTLVPVRNILDAASEQADLLGRCATPDGDGGFYSNSDCLANRLIPALKNFEHMSAAGEKVFKAIETETPATAVAVRKTAEQVAGIAADVHTVADDYLKPEPWYKKVFHTAVEVLSIGRLFF